MFGFAAEKFKLFGLSHADDFIDPLKQGFVVCGFGYENIENAVCFERVDKRLLGIKAITGNDNGRFWMDFGKRGITWRISGWKQLPKTRPGYSAMSFPAILSKRQEWKGPGKVSPDARNL
jgi:hypothetical protein